MAEPKEIPDLRSLIEAADADALRAFLVKQASRNEALAIKLRAHLAGQRDITPGANPFSQVLGLLVRHNVHGTIRLTRRSVQILREICGNFVNLEREYLQQGELRKAWDVAAALISHLHLLMDRYHGADQKLVTELTECYAQLQALLSDHPAPELRESIYNVLWDLASRSQHVIYDLRFNAVTCLIRVSSDPEDQHRLSEMVLHRAFGHREQDPAISDTWSALLFMIPGHTSDYASLLTKGQAYRIAHLLFNINDLEALGKLIYAVPVPPDLTGVQRVQWARWKFDHALNLGTPEMVLSSGWELLYVEPDIDMYRRMKSVLSSQRVLVEHHKKEIHEALLCGIYAEEKQWPELTDALRSAGSIRLLITYCTDVLSHCAAPATLIHEIAHGFASHHGGPQSLEEVRMLVDVLHEQNADAVRNGLINRLTEDFPGRFDTLRRGSKARKQSRIPTE